MNGCRAGAWVAGLWMAAATAGWAGDVADIALPVPRTDGGKPLMQALKARQSARAYGAAKLEPQALADLLWAACGISRPENGKRTAPSAKNWQEIEVYAVLEEGAYLYDAKANSLRGVAKGDFRALTGKQDFVAGAPVNLVYVADAAKMKDASPEDQALWSAADAGFISENVYLFCASEGLATVVRGAPDRKPLADALRLEPQKKILLVQTVGHPAAAAPAK